MEMTITVPRIGTVEKQVQLAQKQASARRLSLDDIKAARVAYRAGLRYAAQMGIDPATVRVEIDGGAVPNSYKFWADTTLLILEKGEASASRASARFTAGGDDGQFCVRMLAPDKRKSREIPPLRLWKENQRGRKVAGEWVFDL